MCQYLATVGKNLKLAEPENAFKLAINVPTCKENGDFEEVQCVNGECYCADESGAEISGTR